MVKNTIGGSKTKGFARKSYNKPSSTTIRLPTHTLEKLAIVTKMNGGGRCIVITNEQMTLNCVIRNKFKARFKSNNLISIHSIILVGLREWETPDNFKICDLLEVYSSDDINHLRLLPALSHTFALFDNIHNNTHNTHNTHNNNEFEFSIHDNTHTTTTHNNNNNTIGEITTYDYTHNNDYDFIDDI